jgi:RelB Antitoxin alpha helical domain
MLDIPKQYVTDENQNPLAVQIPIATFQQIEEILEDFGLVRLMEEVEDDERLTGEEALAYYNALKQPDNALKQPDKSSHQSES